MNADDQLREMITACGFNVRGSYRHAEVCRILGISRATFYRLTDSWKPDDEGNPVNPCSLKTYMLRAERRVSWDELVSFLERNDSWERQYGYDPRQMDLFAEA
jgi:transposase